MASASPLESCSEIVAKCRVSNYDCDGTQVSRMVGINATTIYTNSTHIERNMLQEFWIALIESSGFAQTGAELYKIVQITRGG